MSETASILKLGGFLLVAGMSVVFASLLLLMLAIKVIQRFGAPRPAAAARVPEARPEPEVSGVLMAAIAVTLLLDAEQAEEEERLVLTLQALPRPYPNWWQSRIARAYWAPHITMPPRADVLRGPDPGREHS